MVLPIHIFQQNSELGNWQFGAAISVILLLSSMLAVFVYQRLALKTAGGIQA